MTRHDAREQALSLIFQLAFTEEPVAELAEAAEFCGEEKLDEYAVRAARLVQEHFLEIDQTINRHSPKWRVTRLPKVTAAILRLAVCEITYLDEIPTGVAINEAVELAKKFAGDEDPAYVNGVLGGFARELEAQAKVQPAGEAEVQ